ncbi:hypothetical protein C404_19110 [Ralstonia sp. AU12-08]|nr:hypothetical protein C404_19110 [Ralstonia sp. AU12-08]
MIRRRAIFGPPHTRVRRMHAAVAAVLYMERFLLFIRDRAITPLFLEVSRGAP